MPLTLDARDQALLDGTAGPAAALAMRVVVRTAESMEAEHLLDITGAHIDSCLYHGQAGLDFAQRLADDGAQVSVPTTLNVSSLDLLHPELYRGDAHTRDQARALMNAYEAMGCEPFRFSSSLSNATRECTAAPATVLTPLRLGGFGVGPRKDELPAVRFSEAVTSFRDAFALARGSLALKLVR